MAISNVDNTTGAGEPLNTGFDKVNQAIDRINQFDALSTGDISILDTLSGLSAGQASDLVAITEAEYTQLQNIGTTTISSAQWGYLGALFG